MNNLLFVGNSHLAGVKSCFESMYFSSTYKKTFFAPTNYSTINWQSLEKNAFLRKFTISGEKIKGYEIDLTQDNTPTELVLVGLGILGDGMVRCHGPMSHETSPKLPILYQFKHLEKKDDACISLDCVKVIYETDITSKITVLKKIIDSRHFKKISWIASPDMTEQAGMERFGADIVTNGFYKAHINLYEEVLNGILEEEQDIKEILIRHPRELTTDSGFTHNNFFIKDKNKHDIHVTPEYYHSSLTKAFSHLK